MRMRIRYLLISLLIAMVAIPAYSATYDATGRWFIETDPGQTISFSGTTIEVPDAWLWATISQLDGGDAFEMTTDEISELGDIYYEGGGVVSGSQYDFDGVLTEEISIRDLPGYESFPFDIIFEISLDGFLLNSENDLSGRFDIAGVGEVTFTGERAVVPLPAGIWLLGSGIVALFRIRRRSHA